jgi:hypothetical protein
MSDHVSETCKLAITAYRKYNTMECIFLHLFYLDKNVFNENNDYYIVLQPLHLSSLHFFKSVPVTLSKILVTQLKYC